MSLLESDRCSGIERVREFASKAGDAGADCEGSRGGTDTIPSFRYQAIALSILDAEITSKSPSPSRSALKTDFGHIDRSESVICSLKDISCAVEVDTKRSITSGRTRRECWRALLLVIANMMPPAE